MQQFQFHHLGYISNDFENDVRSFSLIGYKQKDTKIEDPLLRVSVVFLSGPGPTIELVTPLEETRHLDVWLQQRSKTYHYAYLTENMEKATEHLLSNDGVLVQKPLSSVAFSGRKVCFVMLPNRQLIELIENVQ